MPPLVRLEDNHTDHDKRIPYDKTLERRGEKAMYRMETQRQIQTALNRIVASGNGMPVLWSSDYRELAENLDLLSKLVADQLWAEGYELKLREMLPAGLALSQLA